MAIDISRQAVYSLAIAALEGASKHYSDQRQKQKKESQAEKTREKGLTFDETLSIVSAAVDSSSTETQ